MTRSLWIYDDINVKIMSAEFTRRCLMKKNTYLFSMASESALFCPLPCITSPVTGVTIAFVAVATGWSLSRSDKSLDSIEFIGFSSVMCLIGWDIVEKSKAVGCGCKFGEGIDCVVTGGSSVWLGFHESNPARSHSIKSPCVTSCAWLKSTSPPHEPLILPSFGGAIGWRSPWKCGWEIFDCLWLISYKSNAWVVNKHAPRTRSMTIKCKYDGDVFSKWAEIWRRMRAFLRRGEKSAYKQAWLDSLWVASIVKHISRNLGTVDCQI